MRLPALFNDMKKITRIVSAILVVILGYMVATDAIGRWFGLWGSQYAFNLLYILSLPWLTYMVIDKEQLKQNSDERIEQ